VALLDRRINNRPELAAAMTLFEALRMGLAVPLDELDCRLYHYLKILHQEHNKFERDSAKPH
jgi:hypothetical protein